MDDIRCHSRASSPHTNTEPRPKTCSAEAAAIWLPLRLFYEPACGTTPCHEYIYTRAPAGAHKTGEEPQRGGSAVCTGGATEARGGNYPGNSCCQFRDFKLYLCVLAASTLRHLLKQPKVPGRPLPEPSSSSLVSRLAEAPSKLTLRSRLLLSFVGIVLFAGVVSASLGVGLIHRILPQVENVLAVDLSAANELYRQYLSHIADATRLMAQQRMLKENIEQGDIRSLAAPLQAIRQSQDFDILVLADLHGKVLFPLGDHGNVGSSGIGLMMQQALRQRKEISSAVVLSRGDLAAQSPELPERARIDPVVTAHAPSGQPNDVSEGLVAAAAIPVMSDDGGLLGVLCAGQLLNGRNNIADRIRSGLYRDDQFAERDVAVVSIFLRNKRIATTATMGSGERAIGTLASQEVYERVVQEGERWVRPGYIVDDWYLTAYEPIRDLRGKVVGALGLGLLARKFEDTQRHALLFVFVLTMVAVLLAIVMSYELSSSIMKPVTALIAATRKIAADPSPQPMQVLNAPPEIQALGQAFNHMAYAIHRRDQQIHRQTSEKLMRSDRLAMIGQLAAGVAHEINNPLGSILLFSRLIMQQVPAQGRLRENLDRIEKETKRCHTIVKSLLDFARERKPLVESLDVNQLLDATLKLFEGQFLFQNIQIVKDYDSKLPKIEADQSQLQQVFVNIILNAADAMKGKGRLVLMTRAQDPDQYIEISISDTGCGIPPENIDRIFDPFFTTKGVGHGTGLGLSVSYGIIQSHNGDIRVSSTPGSGATFTITLPMAKGSQ